MTTHIGISPHLTSPVGEGQIPLLLDCQWLIRLGVTCISPTGENERGLMMITGVMMTNGVTVHHLFSSHLTSPVGNPS